MAYINITGVSIHGQAWSNISGYYQGSSSYGLQEALSISGSSAFDGLDNVADIIQYRGNHSFYGYSSYTKDELTEYLDQSNRAIFFDEACPQGSCAAACDGDFATMFQIRGLHTVHNCLLAPNLAFANLTPVNEAFLENRYALGPALNATAKNVVYQVNECLRNICSSLPGCEIPDKFSSDFTTDWPDVYYNYRNSSRLLSEICESVPSVVNGDLGGIGVYISYWIQSGLAIFGFVVTLIFIVLIPHAHLGLLSIRRGRLEARFQAEYIHRRARKRMSPFVAALTEFHKQQCFFMLATNIAALVVVERGGFDPQSLQQIYDNYTFLNEIALSGILPITFTLFNLYLISMISWYLIFLSCLSIILSIATLGVVGHFRPSESDLKALVDVASKGGPQECGGTQPHVYCFNSYITSSFYEYSSYEDNTVLYSNPSVQLTAFCLVVLVLIVIYKLKPHRWKISGQLSAMILIALGKTAAQYKRFSQTGFVRNSASSISRFAKIYWTRLSRMADTYWTKLMMKSPQYVEGSVTAIVRWSSTSMEWFQGWTHGRNWKKLALAFFKFTLYATIIGFYLYSFLDFMGRLTLFSVDKSWNFGQIVAITVWFPPVCEYVHLSIRGMRRGFDHRLLSPYHVTSRASTAETLVASEGGQYPNFDDRASVTTGASIEAVPLRKYPKRRSQPPNDETIFIRRDSPSGQRETKPSRTYSGNLSGPQGDDISPMRRDSPPYPQETDSFRTYSKRRTESPDDESVLMRRDSPPEQHETESFRNETWHDGMSYDSVRGGKGRDSPEQTVATEPADWLLPEVQVPSRSFSMGMGRTRSDSAGWG